MAEVTNEMIYAMQSKMLERCSQLDEKVGRIEALVGEAEGNIAQLLAEVRTLLVPRLIAQAGILAHVGSLVGVDKRQQDELVRLLRERIERIEHRLELLD